MEQQLNNNSLILSSEMHATDSVPMASLTTKALSEQHSCMD